MLHTNEIWIGTMMYALRCEKKELRNILSKAYELGLRNIDTSPSYIDGKSDEILIDSSNNIIKNNFKIHSKIGRAFKKNLSKNYTYLSKENIESALEHIYLKFKNFKIGSIQIHLDSNDNDMISTLLILKNELNKCNIDKIGVCNLSDERINFLLKKTNIPFAEISCQRRFCLGIIDSNRNLNIDYIGYGIKNSGSFLTNKSSTKSRMKIARDANEIKKRHSILEKVILTEKIIEECKNFKISVTDFSIASAQLSGLKKIIISPSKVKHLDSIERLMEKDYWLRNVEFFEHFKSRYLINHVLSK